MITVFSRVDLHTLLCADLAPFIWVFRIIEKLLQYQHTLHETFVRMWSVAQGNRKSMGHHSDYPNLVKFPYVGETIGLCQTQKLLGA